MVFPSRNPVSLGALRRPPSKSLPLPVRPRALYEEHGPENWFALLIGITYASHEDEKARLDRPNDDVHLIRNMLLDKGWLPDHIKILSDETVEEHAEYDEPTKENILSDLHALVWPAIHGPRRGQSHKFFFYFAGHGAQEDDPTGLEDDGKNECIVPLDSDIKGALGSQAQPKVSRRAARASGNQASASTSHPPSNDPAPRKPRRRQTKTKFLASDCSFTMQSKAVMSPIKKKVDGVWSSLQVLENQLHPQPTADHGWINDDTLCDILCRQLPANCCLRAFFDMCHSGTALDLENNYNAESIPSKYRWWFDWVDAYMLPSERNSKNWIWYIKPPTKGDASHNTRRKKGKALARPRKAESLPLWMESITRAVVGGMAGTVRGACRAAAGAVMANSGAYVKSQQYPAIPPTPMIPTLIAIPEGPEPHIVIQDNSNSQQFLSPISNENPMTFLTASPIDMFPIKPIPDMLPVAAEGSEMAPTTPGSTVLDLDNVSDSGVPDASPSPQQSGTGPARSCSAPGGLAHLEPPKPPKPIVGDILCLGASSDWQTSSDTRSLAVLLLELYESFGEWPTHYQLLLWVTRNVKRRQTPQLSSSWDLSADWHRPFLT